MENTVVSSIIFILATFIVSMTVYIILSIIIEKFPTFLETGIWKNPFLVLMIGTLCLFILVMVIVLIYNKIEFNYLTNKIVTLLLGYVVVFILTIMADAFLKGMGHIERRMRLFICSMAIVLGLEAMILFGLIRSMSM